MLKMHMPIDSHPLPDFRRLRTTKMDSRLRGNDGEVRFPAETLSSMAALSSMAVPSSIGACVPGVSPCLAPLGPEWNHILTGTLARPDSATALMISGVIPAQAGIHFMNTPCAASPLN